MCAMLIIEANDFTTTKGPVFWRRSKGTDFPEPVVHESFAKPNVGSVGLVWKIQEQLTLDKTYFLSTL